MLVIKDFHELWVPASDSDGAYGSDWCSYDKDLNGLYYLLNDGSNTLADLVAGPNPKEFYFKTSEDCHWAMAQYYISHGKKYPYMDEWDAVTGISNTVADLNVNVGGSKVMRFK